MSAIKCRGFHGPPDSEIYTSEYNGLSILDSRGVTIPLFTGSKTGSGIAKRLKIRLRIRIHLQNHKGASIYDVRTEGGGGVGPKEDVVREVA